MKLEPVKNYTPHYPGKEQVELNRLLLQNKPGRWKTGGAAMLLMTALTAGGVTGCRRNVFTTLGEIAPPASTRKINMAPVFEGIYREYDDTDSALLTSGLSFWTQSKNLIQLGNYPGIGHINPLTEEAAFTIIQDELKNQGLTGKASSKKVDVPLDGKSVKWSFDMDVSGAKEPVYAEFLPLNSHDTQREQTERDALSLPPGTTGLETYSTKNTAEALREKLSEVYDDSTGAIFYADYWSGEANLRAQVDEFVQWLKASGLI